MKGHLSGYPIWKDLTTVPVVQRPDVTYIEPMGSSYNYRGAFRVKPDGTVAITPDADPLEVQAILEHKARLAGLDEHHPTSGECW